MQVKTVEDRLRRLSLRDTLIVSAMLGAFYYFFIFDAPDLQTQIRQRQGEIRALQNEIAQLMEVIDRGSLVKNEIDQVKSEIQARSSRFRMNMAAERVQQVISEEARAAGIFFEAITDSKTVGTVNQSSNRFANQNGEAPPDWFNIDRYIHKFEISTTFKGSYAQVMRFLSYLTRTEDVITLRKVTITSGQSNFRDIDSGRSPTLTFEASFEAYSLLQNVMSDTLKPEEGAL